MAGSPFFYLSLLSPFVFSLPFDILLFPSSFSFLNCPSFLSPAVLPFPSCPPFPQLSFLSPAILLFLAVLSSAALPIILPFPSFTFFIHLSLLSSAVLPFPSCPCHYFVFPCDMSYLCMFAPVLPRLLNAFPPLISRHFPFSFLKINLLVNFVVS